MKIEKYTKVTGAYVRSKYRETLENEIHSSKADKLINVQKIEVKVKVSSGTFTFQGDETSQNRLSRIGWAMEKTKTPTKKWKTSDNQIVDLTIDDIAKIVMAASDEQDKLWLN